MIFLYEFAIFHALWLVFSGVITVARVKRIKIEHFIFAHIRNYIFACPPRAYAFSYSRVIVAIARDAVLEKEGTSST